MVWFNMLNPMQLPQKEYLMFSDDNDYLIMIFMWGNAIT
jgi:hypothetical protein